MKRRKSFFQRLTYVLVPMLFIIIIYGTYKVTYTDDMEDIENISEKVFKIPNSARSINKFEYEGYIVNEKISIVDLALKLKKDARVLQYNNPETIKNPFLYPGMRLIVYKDSVIFYKVKEGDTLTEISSKFGVSKESVREVNSNIVGENISNVKYLVIKNPVLNDNIIVEKGMEEIVSIVNPYIEYGKNILHEEERKVNVSYMKIVDRNNGGSNNIKKNHNIRDGIQEDSDYIMKGKETKYVQETYEEGDELYWPVVSTEITNGFGEKEDPVSGERKNYKGIDIISVRGAAVNSGVTGEVTHAGKERSYGNLIEVRRSDGLKVRYAHLGKIEVKVGQIVRQGDKIGEVGGTGLSTRVHLHYEVLLNDIFVDPMKFNYR